MNSGRGFSNVSGKSRKKASNLQSRGEGKGPLSRYLLNFKTHCLVGADREGVGERGHFEELPACAFTILQKEGRKGGGFEVSPLQKGRSGKIGQTGTERKKTGS